jgi:hypothetical protein
VCSWSLATSGTVPAGCECACSREHPTCRASDTFHSQTVCSDGTSLLTSDAQLRSSASASPAFEGRGGELLSIEIARTLERMLANSHALDYKSLCIVPGQQVWHIYVDAVVCGIEMQIFIFGRNENSLVVILAKASRRPMPNIYNAHAQVLVHGGNLMDAISFAVKSALFDTRSVLPALPAHPRPLF